MFGIDERAYREKCLHDGIASFELEGIFTENRVITKGQEYIDGRISIHELIDWYYHLYEKQMREEGSIASYVQGLMMNNLSVLSLVQIQDSGVTYPFNLFGLYRLHRDIFKYCREGSFLHYQPNKIREETPYGEIWSKERNLFGGCVSVAVYSSMSIVGQESVDDYLRKLINLNALRQLSKRSLADIISYIYAALDYLHPFYDGNSRALREFTRELCRELGYDLQWGNCIKKPDGKAELFLARDYEVNQIALKNTEIPELRYDISQYLEKQKKHTPLCDLIYDNLESLES